MIFEASRAKAVDKLNTFVEQNLSDYSKLKTLIHLRLWLLFL